DDNVKMDAVEGKEIEASAAGDSDRGLADADGGKGWATIVEGWPTVDEERKKGRDVEDSSRADGGEEATTGGRGEDAAGSEGEGNGRGWRGLRLQFFGGGNGGSDCRGGWLRLGA
ncbi:hypothetical protein GW17_00039681, partial [Ensete ventricosum]